MGAFKIWAENATVEFESLAACLGAVAPLDCWYWMPVPLTCRAASRLESAASPALR